VQQMPGRDAYLDGLLGGEIAKAVAVQIEARFWPHGRERATGWPSHMWKRHGAPSSNASARHDSATRL
jgi:hypothetical protein